MDSYCGCGADLLDYMSRLRGECARCFDLRLPPDLATPQQLDDHSDGASATDPVTDRLIRDALPRHGLPHCPKCARRGRFIRMALCCEVHGPFGGC
jgi:hypothetical protein